MKADIHPNYDACTIKCTCGNVIETRSTRKEIHIAICSNCHPFYTGQQKFVDTAGRIEKFQKRFGITEKDGTKSAISRGRKPKKAAKVEAEKPAKKEEKKDAKPEA